jgi:hypothetical protein
MVITVLVVATAITSTAASAHAYQFATRERGVSDHDTTPSKTAIATCPGGLLVLGTGGRIVAGHGRVSLAAMVPDPMLTSVTVRGEAVPGHNQPWSVVAVAVCGPPPGWLHLEQSDPASTTAACPNGPLIGTGFELPADPPEPMLLTGLVPDLVEASVTVQVEYRGPTFSLPTAYAICVTDTDYQLVTSTSSFDGASTATAVATGEHTILGIGGSADGVDVFIDAMLPDPDLRQVAVRATRLDRYGARVAGLKEEDDESVTAIGIDAEYYY